MRKPRQETVHVAAASVFALMIAAALAALGAMTTPAGASPTSIHRLPQLPGLSAVQPGISPWAWPATWPRPAASGTTSSTSSPTIASTGAAMPDLQRIDPNVGDLNPLSKSLRQLDTGLREPAAFDQIYRVPGRDDLFLRANGAVYAVFPQSAYFQYKGRMLAQIPASTVFHIGAESVQSLAPAEAPAEAKASGPDGRVREGLVAEAAIQPIERGPAPVSGAKAVVSHPAPANRKPPIDRAGTRVMAMDEQQLALVELRRQIRADQAEPPASILNRAGYRAARVYELMERAAAVAVAREEEERSRSESAR